VAEIKNSIVDPTTTLGDERIFAIITESQSYTIAIDSAEFSKKIQFHIQEKFRRISVYPDRQGGFWICLHPYKTPGSFGAHFELRRIKQQLELVIDVTRIRKHCTS
jgi:hypothetical protein